MSALAEERNRGKGLAYRSMYVIASSAENHPIFVKRYALQQSMASAERFVDMAGWLKGVECTGDVVFTPAGEALFGPAASVSSEPRLLATSARVCAASKRRLRASSPLDTTVRIMDSATPPEKTWSPVFLG
jgi:hypothetical protein